MSFKTGNRVRRIEVDGPSIPLMGDVSLPGNKNSAMPIVTAAALAPGTTTVKHVPDLSDMRALGSVLQCLGARIEIRGGSWTIRGGYPAGHSIPAELSSHFRGSVYGLAIAGARGVGASMGSVGGDSLSGRTLEPHERAFAGFGLRLEVSDAGLLLHPGRPKAAEFRIDDHGVSATCIAMILAASLDGRSIIRNASLELETDDTLAAVVQLGASAFREGRDLVIRGPMTGSPKDLTIPDDQNVFGTLAVAAAITGGRISCPGSIVRVAPKAT